MRDDQRDRFAVDAEKPLSIELTAGLVASQKSITMGEAELGADLKYDGVHLRHRSGQAEDVTCAFHAYLAIAAS
jgi:hypothetical protein